MEREEILRRALAMARGVLDPDSALDGCTKAEQTELMVIAVYELRRRLDRYGKGQRRARRLLYTLLTPAQLARCRRDGTFVVTGSLGGRYRLNARCGHVEKVERHGRYYWRRWSFCYHEDTEDELPPADRTIAHMLTLTTDEGAFLAEANVQHRSDLWNGEWRRQLNAARREREAVA